MTLRVSGLVVLLLTPAALANLEGIPLQQHAVYRPPGPTSNPNQGGTWTYIQNELNLPLPTWSTDGLTLTVPNSADNTKKKDLWFEIDYPAGTRPAVAPVIVPIAAGVIVPLPPVAGANDWTYHWVITPQPSFEQFNLPPNFFTLQGIAQFEVGTNCTLIPEPGLLAWIVLAGGVTRRRIE